MWSEKLGKKMSLIFMGPLNYFLEVLYFIMFIQKSVCGNEIYAKTSWSAVINHKEMIESFDL